MSRSKAGRISALLEKALAEELKEVTRRWGDDAPDGKKKGDFMYGAVERMRVMDRLLKLEGLKLKVDDAGFGSEFGKDGQ